MTRIVKKPKLTSHIIVTTFKLMKVWVTQTYSSKINQNFIILLFKIKGFK